MKRVLVFLLIIIFNSCNILSQESEQELSKKLDASIVDCVNSRVKYLPDDYFDLYEDTFLKIESILIDQKLLESSSKSSYKKIFSDFESNSENPEYKNIHVNLNSLFDKKIEKIIWLSSPSIAMAPFQCNIMALENNNLGNSNYCNTLIEFIEAGTWENWILNNKLLIAIPDKEFSNIICRASIISILYNHIVFRVQ